MAGLDELNLAPTDVLEALNRLLDDNRELVVSQTGEALRPHPNFMLFATQNPSGAGYGGRRHCQEPSAIDFSKSLWRCSEIELATILERRCRIAPSYALKIVDGVPETSAPQKSDRVFEKATHSLLSETCSDGVHEALLAMKSFLVKATCSSRSGHDP